MLQVAVVVERDYSELDQNGDVTGLLKLIRKISSQIQSDMNIYDAYLEAMKNVVLYHQTDQINISAYLRHFKHLVDMCDQTRG